MTRKDYLLIAEAINKSLIYVQHSKSLATAEQGVGIVASLVTEALADDNPNFNSERFLAACGMPVES
jgi:hypothetical protein